MNDFYDSDMGNEMDADFESDFESDLDSGTEMDSDQSLESPDDMLELVDPDFVIEEVDIPLNEGYAEGLDESFNPEVDMEYPFEPTERELFGETELEGRELDDLIDAQIEDAKIRRDNLEDGWEE